MCTAITYKAKDFYFGRTLDVEFDIEPSVVITPRNYPLLVQNKTISSHYAIIGMAIVFNNYPLYFDASNEKGLSMAGLNFPDNACYFEYNVDKNNITPNELIPYILCDCTCIKDAINKLNNLNIINKQISENIPNTTLHWIISDKNSSIVVEQTKSGLNVYDNPVGVLTNNPNLPWHLTNLTNYINLTSDVATNRLSSSLDLKPFCKGMGAIGLPGDLSSPSRFVRATFAKLNSLTFDTEEENVSQFFHLLAFVTQPIGLASAGNNLYEKTLYTSCCNTDKGIYYYKTYFNSEINAVNMFNENLDLTTLISYPLVTATHINNQN